MTILSFGQIELISSYKLTSHFQVTYVTFWPSDSDSIFEGKMAYICMPAKSAFCFTDFSSFRILHFKQNTFELCRNKSRFIIKLRIFMFHFFAEISGDLLSADLTPDIMDQIISEKWKFLREIR